MCKKVIEKSAKSAGATYANWNENSKLLKVSYTLNKTSGTQIQQAIANAGYDTQDLTADDAAYNKLPGCCQYDRKSKTDKASMGAMKSCCSKAAGTTMKCADMSKCCKDGDMKSCDKSKCKDAVAGKDGKCCTDKSCCKS